MKINPLAATDLYGRAREATRADSPDNGAGFADALTNALNDMRSTIQEGERAATAAMAGKGDVQSVVEALAATEMVLETVVVVRDKVVEAYQEILRMPV